MNVKLNQFFAVAAIIAATLAWQGCGSDTPKGPDCNIPNADLSYTLNIKGIIDQHCISCHTPGSGVSGAIGDYRTYEGIKPFIDNGKILSEVVLDKTMPQGGGMSQAQRDSVNCWIAASYPK